MNTSRIMWIERKDGLAGPARIARVTFSKSRKSIHYKGKAFHTLAGRGFKANYADVETGDEYWISGCHKNGRDALYNTDVEVDEDVCEEYCDVRGESAERAGDYVHAGQFCLYLLNTGLHFPGLALHSPVFFMASGGGRNGRDNSSTAGRLHSSNRQ